MAEQAITTGSSDVGAPAAPFVPSVAQVSFCLVYVWALVLYVYGVLVAQSRRRAGTLEGQRAKVQHLSDPDIESKNQAGLSESTKLISHNGGSKVSSDSKQTGLLNNFWGSSLFRCLALDQDAIVEANSTLLHILEFGAILILFFMCDRTNTFWQAEKSYNRDLFAFLFVCLTIVALGTSLQAYSKPMLLNRPQTEEWKGWMQVLFLLYHYFEARELYNAIRIFIAGYVWMTGFGNFSYYYRTGDFSIGRFCQMMWRLNFLVIFCCIVLKNSYMLYYICPMHTIFTVFVYACLGIGSQLNKRPAWMWAKIALCFVAIFVLWDIKSVFYLIWKPFDWLVGYTDPRKGEQDRLHEWYFRSGLDRYIWIWGMVCAYIHPQATKLLNMIEELPQLRRCMVRAIILSAVGAAFTLYYKTIYVLPKAEYNKVHPYTSWIPLTLWIVARNMTPQLRTWSLRLYGWLGCITLETYLCQFHIWLHSDIADGQPKYLLSLVPGYPMINFALVTAMYIYISNRLFHLTNSLKDRIVPHDNNMQLARNMLQTGLAAAAATGLGWLLQRSLLVQLY